MMTIPITVLNASTAASDDEVAAAVAAVQTQIHRDFAPVWGVDADVRMMAKGAAPPPQSWWVVVLDNSDLGNALGYHDLSSEGLPLAKVFAKTDKLDGLHWSTTLSHEIMEMLVDPNINRISFVATAAGYLVYAYEICDACQSEQVGYAIDGVRVSNFLYPSWFGPLGVARGPFDQCKLVQYPLEILPGGYTMVFDATFGTGWQIVTSSAFARQYRERPRVGSRRERRRTYRGAWLKSHYPNASSEAAASS